MMYPRLTRHVTARSGIRLAVSKGRRALWARRYLPYFLEERVAPRWDQFTCLEILYRIRVWLRLEGFPRIFIIKSIKFVNHDIENAVFCSWLTEAYDFVTDLHYQVQHICHNVGAWM